MISDRHQKRLERCSRLMKAAGLDALLLTKPANMFYLTRDGRLCACAMITQDGKGALGDAQEAQTPVSGAVSGRAQRPRVA